MKTIPNTEQQLLLQTIAEEYLFVAPNGDLCITMEGINRVISKWENMREKENNSTEKRPFIRERAGGLLNVEIDGGYLRRKIDKTGYLITQRDFLATQFYSEDEAWKAIWEYKMLKP